MLYDSYYKKISRVLDFFRKVFKHIVLISTILALIIITIVTLLATKGIVFDDKSVETNFEMTYGEGLPLKANAMLSKVRYEYSDDNGATWSSKMPIVPGTYSVRAVANTTFGGERYGKVYTFVLSAKPIEVLVEDSTVLYGELPEVKSNELSYGDKITCDKVVYEDIAKVDARVTPDKDSVKIFNANGVEVTSSYDIKTVTTDISITQRKIGFTVSGNEMVYNNVMLTYDGYELSSGTLAEGDTEQAVINTKQLSEVGITDVGEFRCTPEFCIVTADGVDVTCHYDIATKVGTLKVVERSIVVKTGSAEKVYDDTELFCEDYEILGGQGLVEGHSLSCESHLSMINADEKPNELKFRIIDASGEVKTQNYSIFYEKGTLKITPRPITVNTADREWMYDNTEHYDDASQISGFCLNHSAKLELPSIINAGEKDNAIKVLNVQNAEGKDVFANYNIIYEKMGKLKITPRPITIKYGDITDVEYNGEYHCNEDYTISGYGLADGDTINFTFREFLEAGEHVNKPTNAFVVSKRDGEEYKFELDGNNYTLTEIPGKITIGKRSLTVKPIDKNKEYDGTALVPDGYQIVDGSIPTPSWNSTSQFEHSVSVTSYSGYIINVEPEDSEVPISSIESITIIRKDSEGDIDVTKSFDIIKETGTLRIDKRPITVTSGSATKVYDGTPLTCHEYTVGDNELVSGHNIDVSDVIFTGERTEPGIADNTFTVNKIKDANQKDVTENYDVTQVEGKLTVTDEIVVELSCSDGEAWGSDGRTKVYDGTPFNISCTVKAEDGSVLTGYTVELLPKIVNVTYPDPRTIDEYDITIKYGENELDNKLDITVTGVIVYKITPIEITLKAIDVEKIYDGETLSINGDCYAITSGTLLEGHSLSASCEATGTDVGVYEYDISVTNIQITYQNDQDVQDVQDVTGNYLVTAERGTLTIKPFEVNIELICDDGESDLRNENLRTKTYDGKEFDISCEVTADTPFPINHTVELPKIVNVTGSDPKTITKDDITIKNGSGEKVNSNFNITLDGVTEYKIKPRPLTVMFNKNNISHIYDAQPHTLESGTDYTLSNGENEGLVEGESIAFTSLTNVGSFTVSDNNKSHIKITNGNINNYDITVNRELTFAVTKRLITVTSGSYGKDYDGTPLAFDEDFVSNLVPGHKITLPNVIDFTDGEQTLTVNDRIDIISVTTNNSVKRNYDIEFSGTFKYEITKRKITVTSGTKKKVYDGTPLAFDEGSVSNLVSGHKITLPNVINVTNGEKTLTVNDIIDIISVTTNNSVKENYDIEFSGTFKYEITKRKITVTSGSYGKVYDGTPLTYHEYTVGDNELVSGHNIVVSFTGTITDIGTADNTFTVDRIKDASQNDVTQNYDVKLNYGTLTVNERKITLTTGSDEKVYDGTPLTKESLEVAEGSENKLVADHIIIINDSPISNWITGSQTAVGSTDNTYTSGLKNIVQIIDEKGNDVTKNYTIEEIKMGTLTVTEPEKEVEPKIIQIYLYPSTKYYDGDVLKRYDYSVGSYHIVNFNDLGDHMFSMIEKNYYDPILSSADAYAADKLFTVKYLNENERWKDYFYFTIDGSETQNYRLEIVDLTGNADSDMVVWGIFKKEIELSSASVTAYYKEGEILSNSAVEVTKGSLLDGHTLYAQATGELSSVGEIENTIDRSSVKILDSFGKDVTSNYAITYIEGTLKYLEQG